MQGQMTTAQNQSQELAKKVIEGSSIKDQKLEVKEVS